MTRTNQLQQLQDHLTRTRIFAWVFIVGFIAVVGLLIAGGGQLPWTIEKKKARWETADDQALRSIVLAARDAAAAGDPVEVAAIHGMLANEAERRAKALMDLWLDRRHPETRLFPQALDNDEWNYRNTAADFFPFLIHAAMFTDDAEALAKLRETLDAEAALAPPGELCQPVHYDTAEPIREDHAELLFASSEYVKDGLVGVYERHGEARVFDRMATVLDAIIAQSRVASKYGLLPAMDSEPNGNLLQVCSRLSYLPDADPAWADLAGRLADAVVHQMLAANHGMPAEVFDYAENRVVEPHTMLRDHGNELPVGLSEAYALAVHRSATDPAWQQRADAWSEPLARMYETILAHGMRDDGMLGLVIDPAGPTLIRDGLNDNWGYVFAGVLLFINAAAAHGAIAPERLEAMIERMGGSIRAVARTDGLASQGSNPDGYYDTLESAIYMAAHFPDPDVRRVIGRWVDGQIGVMYTAQGRDGRVRDHYLDGNFIRTALLDADRLRGGWRLDPWRPDVRVGWAADPDGRGGIVVVASDQPYEGRLIPDPPRHRAHLNLPTDQPRLNSWPQWLTADTITAIRRVDGPAPSPIAPADAARGIALTLPANGRAVFRVDSRLPQPPNR